MEVSGSALFEALVDAVVAIDLSGTIVAANPGAATLSGYSAEELVGKPVGEVFVDELSGIRTRVRQKIASGNPLRREESWMVCRNGDRIPVSITGSPVVEDARVEAILIVARDARKLEQLRRQLLLAERRAMLGILAGGVGHELRNIAQVQIGAVDTLQYALDTKGDLAEAVQSVVRDLERIGEHVMTHANQLTRLAKPQRESIESLRPDEVIGDVVKLLSTGGKLRGITIETTDGSEGLVARTNRARLEQVLFNLVINATEAIRPPGAISIGTFAESRPDGHRRLVFEVRDTGSGMTPEVHARMFEPFYTTKGERQGTGLGLAIVRDIVDSYAGKIAVETAIDQGTTIRFDVPAVVED